MKKLYCTVIALLLIFYTVVTSPSALADDRRSNNAQVSIMSYNVEFLWDGILPEEGNVDFPRKGDSTAADAHMAKIAEVIKQNNPDIINLVEVENIDALTRLNDQFLDGQGYKPYLVKGKDNATGQDVALLTRIDPESIERTDLRGRSGQVTKSVSKNYYAKFDIDGQKLALIGLHFLARPLSESRQNQRQAQSDAIRELASDLRQENYLPIILGDFNDYDAEIKDRNDNVPITNVLSQLKSLGTDTTNDDLINTIEFVPKSERYTSYYDPNRDGEIQPNSEFTAIDFILLPHELKNSVEQVTIFQDYDPREVSDHFPVMVTLDFNSEPQVNPEISEPVIEQPSRTNSLKISSLLPNPIGDETQLESATIQNTGETEVNLIGWRLRDQAGNFWNLDSLSTLQPHENKLILRRGQSMALNNRGDTLELLSPDGTVVDIVTYTNSSPDVPILF